MPRPRRTRKSRRGSKKSPSSRVTRRRRTKKVLTKRSLKRRRHSKHSKRSTRRSQRSRPRCRTYRAVIVPTEPMAVATFIRWLSENYPAAVPPMTDIMAPHTVLTRILYKLRDEQNETSEMKIKLAQALAQLSASDQKRYFDLMTPYMTDQNIAVRSEMLKTLVTNPAFSAPWAQYFSLAGFTCDEDKMNVAYLKTFAKEIPNDLSPETAEVFLKAIIKRLDEGKTVMPSWMDVFNGEPYLSDESLRPFKEEIKSREPSWSVYCPPH